MAPVVLFVQVIGQFGPDSFWFAWRTYRTGAFWLQLAAQLGQLASAAAGIAWAAMILRRDPRFVRTWQLGYIGAVLSAAARWPLHLIYGYPQGVTPATDIAVAIGVLAIFGLWMLYYVRSVRVRTYMGTDKYLRLALFTGKVPGPVPLAPDGI